MSLTSHDPEYQSKVDAIKCALASLWADEAFFSIDELGPVAVKMRGAEHFNLLLHVMNKG